MTAMQAAKMIATLARGALHAYLLKPSRRFRIRIACRSAAGASRRRAFRDRKTVARPA